MKKRTEKSEIRKKSTSPAEHSTKKRKKRKRNIFLSILLYMFMFFGFVIVAAAGLVAGSFAGYVEDTELVDVENLRLNLTSFIYVQDAQTGEYIQYEQLYDTENRIWVSGSEIPDHLKDAFVAIEDERFYSHSGVDLKRFIGAAYQYISNDGNSSYGGSTITQQLIKNLTQDDDYSIRRKVQEIYRAYNLEKELSKDEILEYYLNTIYLSQNCNGVESAAITYFGKNASDLSLAESAVLAGITKFPTKYDPLVNPENNRERQLVILKKMLDLDFITEDEYNEAKNEEVKFMPPKSEEEQHYQSYFTDAAIEQVVEDMMAEYNYTKEYAMMILYNGGLNIYLSMDTEIQAHMDAVYNDPSSFQRASGEVQPQSSMVIMDPYTGLVKGLVGGRGEKEGNRTLNRATQTLRQPGSSIKPLTVYAPAIEYGLVTPGTIINDAPVTYYGWSPRNDDRKFAGRITVSAALRGSRNVPASKICNYLTPEASFNFMQNNLHVDTLVKYRESNGKTFTDVGLAPIALGGLTDGVTVLDMCAAYCTFPNGGKYIKPSLYTKVLDSNGNIFLEHTGEELPAMSETTAKDMISMMQGVVTGGTGTAARLPNMKVAGKTGTTSNNHDRWFVGYTPYYVGAVWFGYDQPAPLRGFSPNPAAVAWRKVMTPIHEGLPNKNFLEDSEEGKYSIMVCEDSGMRATPACTHLTYKIFDKGDVPTKRCTDHPYTFGKNDLSSGGIVEKDEDVEGIVEDTPTTPEGEVPEGEVPEGGASGGESPESGSSGGDSPPANNSGGGETPPPENNTPPNSGGTEGVEGL